MILRLIFCTFICLLISSYVLYTDVFLPDWVEHFLGNMPGDILWEKGVLTIPLPFGSASIGGLVLTLILSLGK